MLRNFFSESKTSRQPLGSIKNYEHFTSERQLIDPSEERNAHSTKQKRGRPVDLPRFCLIRYCGESRTRRKKLETTAD
ncbi:MAG TPA: hypothetical protein VHM88_09505 [Candidatus Acidoferrales bacterium]|nr:hypothetical protein [Candidatus Acidoferrales bacterium]